MADQPRALFKTSAKIALALLTLLALVAIQLQWSSFSASSAPLLPQAGSWEQQAPYPTGYNINGVDMVSPTEAYAVAYTDIVHSTDGGATWEKQARPGYDNLYSVDFFDSQHGIIVGNATYYTSNGGATWGESHAAWGYDVTMASATLAFITDHRVEGYMRTTDGGATWALITMPSYITTIQCFEALNCVAASPDGIYHSYDGGLTWTFVAGEGPNVAGTYFISHNQGWMVYTDIAKRTTDGGATWQTQSLPPGSWIYDSMFTDPNNGWAVGDNIARTTDGGTTWQNIDAAPEALPLWDVDFYDAQHGIAGGDAFLATDSVLLTSSDGGASWVTRTQGSIQIVYDITATDANHAWAAHAYGGKITRTTDGGATWQVAEVGEQYAQLEGIDMADNLHGWAVGFHNSWLDGYIFHTDDGGVSWYSQYDPGISVLRDVAAIDSQNAIVVGGWNGSGPIRDRTTDGGNTWTTYTQNYFPGYNEPHAIVATNPNDAWAIGDNMLLHWNGVQWGRSENAPRQTSLNGITAISSNNIWAVGSSDRPSYHGMMIAHYTAACVSTPIPTAAATNTVPTATNTATPTITNTPTSTNTPIPPRCPGERFTDVCPGDYFYQHVLDLNDLGILSGYNSSPPCESPAHIPCFRPNGLITRGQMAKIISNAAGFSELVNVQEFADVPPGSTFYDFVGRLVHHGVANGYACGYEPSEPCDAASRPYYRVGSNVNRAQMAKFTALAFGFGDTPTTQTFEDVVPDNHFYPFIENLASRNIVGGYPCGGPGEPCGAGNLPYYRYGTLITRGQAAKIVNLARIIALPTPTAVPTASATSTPEATATATPEATATP